MHYIDTKHKKKNIEPSDTKYHSTKSYSYGKPVKSPINKSCFPDGSGVNNVYVSDDSI